MVRQVKKNFHFSKSACLLAVILSASFIIGDLAQNRLIKEIHPAWSKVHIFVVFIFASTILTGIISALFSLIKKDTEIKKVETNDKFIELNKKKFLLLICLIVACWLPLLIIFFPGNIDWDTYRQLFQIYHLLPLSDHHPFFDTLIFGLFWKIGDLLGSNAWSLFLYAIVQYLFTAGAFSLAIYYVNRHSQNIWVARIMFIFFALYPVISQFAMSMSKDSLNGWIFVIYFVQYLEILRTKGEILHQRRFTISLIVICILCALTKKTGLYIIIISDLFLLIDLKQGRKILLLTICSLVFVNNILWSHIILKSNNIAPGSEREKFSAPSQHVALYLQRYGAEMTKKDWEALRYVYNHPEKLPEVYIPYRADNTKSLWKETTTLSDKMQFAKWYVEKGISHPKTFLISQAALDGPLLTFNRWTHFDDDTRLFYFSFDFNKDTESMYYSGVTSINRIHQVMKSSYRDSTHAKWYKTYIAHYLSWTQGLLKPLFSKVLFATWVPLFVLFYGFYSRRKEIVFAMIPVLLNLAIVSIGPVVISRYMVISLYTAPIIVSLPWIEGIGTTPNDCPFMD